MNVDWILHNNINHIVYFGEGKYTEFACGEDTEEDLFPSDPFKLTCKNCMNWLKDKVVTGPENMTLTLPNS